MINVIGWQTITDNRIQKQGNFLQCIILDWFCTEGKNTNEQIVKIIKKTLYLIKLFYQAKYTEFDNYIVVM